MTKNIHATEHHFGWDNSIAPKMVVQPGEKVLVETLDSSAGQITKDSKLADLINLDFGKVNPVTGPILIEGAKAGDAVQITFLEFHTKGWGWTGNIPGFGLLADQFKDPALHIWNFDASKPSTSDFEAGGKVALKPFVGTIGLALAEKGLHSVVPPRNVGGNLDIRDMSAGTVSRLPVEVDGALLSIGDTHAAQGGVDGTHTRCLVEMDDIIKNLKENLKEAYKDTIILTVTEFGRTIKQNGGNGTEHGYGTAIFMAGGLLKKSQVHTDWPGLKRKEMYEGRDLNATIDARSVYASAMSTVFDLDFKRIQKDVFWGEDLQNLSDKLFKA